MGNGHSQKLLADGQCKEIPREEFPADWIFCHRTSSFKKFSFCFQISRLPNRCSSEPESAHRFLQCFYPTTGTKSLFFVVTIIAQKDRKSYYPGYGKTPANWRESDIYNLAAGDIQHFTVGLHGLGQILHDLHILNTSKIECGKFTETGRR